MISKSIDENIAVLEKAFEGWADIVQRKIVTGDRAIYICYVDNLADSGLIEDTVLRGLMVDIHLTGGEALPKGFEPILDKGVLTADIKQGDSLEQGINEVMAGNGLLLIDGFENTIIISARGFPKRGVEKPENEITLQGPKEAFTETLRINTVLIRRRIKDTSLKCKQITVGAASRTDVALMYMEGRVREGILEETEKRLKEISLGAIIDSGYIEQLIEDNKKSPFPLIQLTERPDKAAAEIMEGRVVIVVDTSPFVLIVPTVLAGLYQTGEDYYRRWEIMSFLRIIRYIAGFLSFTLPGLYIAVTLYQPSMIAESLALKLAGARETVPLPTLAEVIFMELAFEALREAGIRLPSAVGNTLGIVGGIIIGQAAVDAGLVSPMVVIVVALTAICSFAIPNVNLSSAYRLVKYLILIISGFMGVYGWFLGIVVLLIHLCSLESFGIPYLYPFVGAESLSELRDSFIRVPLSRMKASVFNRLRKPHDS